MTRRLAAVLVADAAGYSRLMHKNEEATRATFNTTIESFVVPSIRRHSGRLVKTTGDGFLAEFSSAVEAVRSALDFQNAITKQAMPLPPQQRLLFRVGIDVGDIIVEDHDIFGDHVNIAARLEQLAQPGSILISANARNYVSDRVTCRFRDLGQKHVKNIGRPIRVFEVLPASAGEEPRASASRQPGAEPGHVSRLDLIGPVSLRIDEQDILLQNLKARAVLGYAALGESRRETRERLVGLLWSASSEPRAQGALRQVVRRLRDRLEAAGCFGLQFGPHDIGIDPNAIQVDVLDVLKATDAGEVHPLLLERKQLTDELLAGLEHVDPAFRVWLVAKRNTLRDRLLFSLENAMAAAEPRSLKESRLAIALVNLDPTHEEASRRLMRSRAAAGDLTGALRIYNTLSDLLAKDYGMQPTADTKQLVADIRAGNSLASPPRPQPAPAAGLSKEAARLVISLPPVTMHEVGPEKSHLVTGFRQHLIASLVRFREWQVTDAPFGDVAMGEPDRAASRYELLIDVHQTGPALHLLLTLKQHENNLYVWSDGFELKLENWFEYQRQVVQRIALALNVHLSAERLHRLSEQPDVSLGVYDRWLRSQTLIRTFNLDHWQRAETQFREILQTAPNFVPAYCGLADMQNTEHIVYPGKLRSRELERQAIGFAGRAVELDPSNGNAHRSLGWANAMLGQHTKAAMHVETAYELNSNDPWTHFSAALLLAFCGRIDRAIELVHRARDMALVPGRIHWAYMVDIHFLNGDYRSAVEAAVHAQDSHRTVRAWRAAALAQLGEIRAAAEDAAAFLASIRANWFGAGPATDEAILRWMLHLYPISRREDWERLRDGLRLAGMPVEAIEYRSWEQASG
jgi:class 3 adenylate cyclase/DNA-binding SARP family transcriptional activator